MINSVTTPLQLTASAALLNNTGINGLPADLTAALLAFNNLTVISYLRNSINTYAAQSFATAGTLLSLQSLGSPDCPALGDRTNWRHLSRCRRHREIYPRFHGSARIYHEYK